MPSIRTTRTKTLSKTISILEPRWGRDKMTETEVVNKREEPADIYIGRGKNGANICTTRIGEYGWLGNPFKLTDYSREESIQKYKIVFLEMIEHREGFREAVLDLKGKKLGCWCKPKACHGDVIKNWIEEQ